MARVIVAEKQRGEFLRTLQLFLTSGPNGGPVPWRHGGRGFKGTDCIGMPSYALRLIGVDPQDRRDYPMEADGEELRAGLEERFGPPLRSPAFAKAGDIVLMRWYSPGGKDLCSHVGVLMACPYPTEATHPLMNFTLIHASRPGSSLKERHWGVVHHRIDARWASRIVAIYSLTGAE